MERPVSLFWVSNDFRAPPFSQSFFSSVSVVLQFYALFKYHGPALSIFRFVCNWTDEWWSWLRSNVGRALLS